MTNPRPEQEIFDELAALAATPGFAHVIAAFCLRDNWIRSIEEMHAEDMAHLHSPARFSLLAAASLGPWLTASASGRRYQKLYAARTPKISWLALPRLSLVPSTRGLSAASPTSR